MTLGDLIDQLRELPPDHVVGLGKPHSFRGSYDELAFAQREGATAAEMLKEAEAAVGGRFEGWKGGNFWMEPNTDCWVAEMGQGGVPLCRVHLRVGVKPTCKEST